MPITFKNVNSRESAQGPALLDSAGERFDSIFEGLRGEVERQQGIRQQNRQNTIDTNTQNIRDRFNRINSLDQAKQARDEGLLRDLVSERGKGNVDREALSGIATDRIKALREQETNQANAEQARAQNEITQAELAEQRRTQEEQPIVSRAKTLFLDGKADEAEKLLKDNNVSNRAGLIQGFRDQQNANEDRAFTEEQRERQRTANAREDAKRRGRERVTALGRDLVTEQENIRQRNNEVRDSLVERLEIPTNEDGAIIEEETTREQFEQLNQGLRDADLQDPESRTALSRRFDQRVAELAKKDNVTVTAESQQQARNNLTETINANRDLASEDQQALADETAQNLEAVNNSEKTALARHEASAEGNTFIQAEQENEIAEVNTLIDELKAEEDDAFDFFGFDSSELAALTEEATNLVGNGITVTGPDGEDLNVPVTSDLLRAAFNSASEENSSPDDALRTNIERIVEGNEGLKEDLIAARNFQDEKEKIIAEHRRARDEVTTRTEREFRANIGARTGNVSNLVEANQSRIDRLKTAEEEEQARIDEFARDLLGTGSVGPNSTGPIGTFPTDEEQFLTNAQRRLDQESLNQFSR